MLKSLTLTNFTVFSEAEFKFGKNLNVIIGENGAGKSHVLKAAYTAIAVSASKPKNGGVESLRKSDYETDLADKLQGVFMPDGLWRLVKRSVGNGQCQLNYTFNNSKLNLKLSFSRRQGAKLKVEVMPKLRVAKRPVFFPTRELLTVAPGFVSLYETTQLSFDETWRDTCLLLEAPLARGARDGHIKLLLEPLEKAMGGSVRSDKSGRFYLNLATGVMEMHLVAEGLRKLAMVARMIATGSLLDKGYLFWDEPESNLNPKMIRTLARTIMEIAKSGIQVFVATHSLFLMRELHILQKREIKNLETKCFGLHIDANGSVSVSQGDSMDDVGDITALEEDVQQSERYIETEMGLEPIIEPSNEDKDD